MSKRILVTGGAGFIGSHVADLLIEEGYDVVVFDNLSSGKEENLKKHDNILIEIDFREGMDVHREFLLETNGVIFDAVIHLAAQPSLINSKKRPWFDADTNILGTISLLSAMKGTGKLIFASTSAIYDQTKVSHLTEDMDKYGQPDSPYGISKKAAEMYIRHMMPNHVIFRLPNVYGSRQRPLGKNQVVPLAIKHILHGDEFLVHSNGVHTRDYMYVGDVAKAMLQAVESPIVGTFNLATGKSTSTMELLNTLKEVSERDGEWQMVDEKKDDRLHVSMSNARFLEVFGKRKFTTLKTGLKRTFEWWRKQ